MAWPRPFACESRKQHQTSIYLEQESVEPRVVAAGQRGLVDFLHSPVGVHHYCGRAGKRGQPTGGVYGDCGDHVCLSTPGRDAHDGSADGLRRKGDADWVGLRCWRHCQSIRRRSEQRIGREASGLAKSVVQML